MNSARISSTRPRNHSLTKLTVTSIGNVTEEPNVDNGNFSARISEILHMPPPTRKKQPLLQPLNVSQRPKAAFKRRTPHKAKLPSINKSSRKSPAKSLMKLLNLQETSGSDDQEKSCDDHSHPQVNIQRKSSSLKLTNQSSQKSFAKYQLNDLELNKNNEPATVQLVDWDPEKDEQEKEDLGKEQSIECNSTMNKPENVNEDYQNMKNKEFTKSLADIVVPTASIASLEFVQENNSNAINFFPCFLKCTDNNNTQTSKKFKKKLESSKSSRPWERIKTFVEVLAKREKTENKTPKIVLACSVGTNSSMTIESFSDCLSTPCSISPTCRPSQYPSQRFCDQMTPINLQSNIQNTVTDNAQFLKRKAFDNQINMTPNKNIHNGTNNNLHVKKLFHSTSGNSNVSKNFSNSKRSMTEIY